MTHTPTACIQIAEDLLAAAMGEAAPEAAERVERHAAACGACRRELESYRALDRTVSALGAAPRPPEPSEAARRRLASALADLKSRLVAYRIFPSPLGNILIARSELGISLVEYLDRGASLGASRLIRERGLEAVEGGPDLEAAHRELAEYLTGRRRRLEWPLDLRLARSDFQRAVLEATAALPYGAVASYAGIAQAIGKGPAVRAVAQALRWNPLPIVIPCHRVIGSSGALTGYAGSKLNYKERLLALEGVPLAGEPGASGIRSQAMYVLYPGDEEYCVPSCASLDTRAPAPLTRFASREAAENAGLRPCTACRPDLHPISR
jgi:methylated-DNA-[protein]-cysteine S-methyltransferase